MEPRHHLYLDDELTQRLEQLAARPGASKSAIVADALKAWFTRGAAIEIDPVILARLDRTGRALSRIERDLQITLRSEEHTSELPSLMRNSSDVFCLKTKKNSHTHTQNI